ncbi:type II secretion system F family protein [Vibrio parahaemolyticus]|uniref:type II secretion system F family protein n=1 Tax=Vibrio parahaemolyticus TaxID=670 RepID=UPI0038916FD7
MNEHTMFIGVLLLVVSIILAFFIMKLWDYVRMDVIARQAIGSTRNNFSKNLLKNALSKVSFNKEETKSKMISAGIYDEIWVDIYYLLKFVPFSICLIAILSEYITKELDATSSMISVLISLIAFVIIPDTYLTSKGKKNIRRLSSKLPFLLDLMSICIRTGMTVESCLNFLGKELYDIDKNLAYTVSVVSERTRLVGIEKSLDEFYVLVPTNEFQSFVMTLKQNIQYGSSIAPVITSLAVEIREIQMMDLEEKVGKMGAKISIPLITFIMVPIIVLIAAPGIMRLLMS